jgi:hypothetical protein
MNRKHLLLAGCALLVAPSATAVTLRADAIGMVAAASHTLGFTAGLPVAGLATGGGWAETAGFWWPTAPSTVGVGPHGLPLATRLLQNAPNPFNPATTLRFEVAGAAGTTIATSLDIHDLRGNRIAALLNEPLAPGTHEVRWDARSVASGVYLAVLRAGETTSTIRLVAIK